MKRLFALILTLLVLAGCGAKEAAVDPATEETAAEVSSDAFGAFSAETLDGETLTEAVFSQADLTVVNLWGTFCGPCIQEMPTLGALHEELEDVQFLGIVLDCNDQYGGIDPDQAELAADIMAQAGAEYDCLVLNQSLAMIGMANFQYIPTTLFVDRDGNIVGTEIVGAMDEAGWRETIAERLEMAQ
ncbi:MAG: TlpA family protein disulfide reductase [Oscillospiraceae bacterium]|nr:TlpA family protein disulfide reductase [Oscillospiraceae bacterium]